VIELDLKRGGHVPKSSSEEVSESGGAALPILRKHWLERGRHDLDKHILEYHGGKSSEVT
jgi:hypothetical protein